MPMPRSLLSFAVAAPLCAAALAGQQAANAATARTHWSFAPIRVPAGPIGDAPTTTAAIDAAIDGALAARGVPAAPPADRATLLRRLAFDLTGLPPSPDEVAAFCADAAPDAYERAVERLLQSPHYGERMAVFWLDLVRYADTVGYHGDQPVSVSPFRDWVIEAFRVDLPFDRFTIEQLAGDLLPEPTRSQQVASGYQRLGMMSAEGGLQPKEYLAKYLAERVRNVAGAWLGVTLGCAECHDHKYDPFTARDFYRFAAHFADLDERGLYSGDDWGPKIPVPTAAQERARGDLTRAIDEVRAELAAETPERAAARAAWEAALPAWRALAATTTSARSGSALRPRADGALLASGDVPAQDAYTLAFAELPAATTALRLDVLPDDALPQRGPGRAGNGNFVVSEVRVAVVAADDSATDVPLRAATASYEQTGAAGGNPYGKWAVAAAIDGDQKGATWGWAIMEQAGRANFAVFELATPLTLPAGAQLRVTIAQEHASPAHVLGCFRLAATAHAGSLAAADQPPPDVATAQATPASARSDAAKAVVAAHYRSVDPSLAPARARLAELDAQLRTLDAAIPSTLVARAVTPRPVRVLRRGDWMDERGELVAPATPAVFGPAPAAEAPRAGRRDLARWLVADDNPLVARAFVNRVWALLFGAGLSRRLDDLGAQGEAPSHPELLDRLAHDFRAHGWSVRGLVRAIVQSRAYQRASVVDNAQRARDPDNRWLARQGRFRLDAEFVRDNALAVSGLLVRDVGGRSVFPYQPKGYWAFLNFPTREWRDSEGSQLHRRGLYTHWQRQYVHPSLLAFDAPSREECTAQRPRSNTPLQALALLNDPTYVEAARAFAARLLQAPGDDRARAALALQAATGRPALADELTALVELLTAHRAHFAADRAAADALLAVGSAPRPADVEPAELAAWTSVARVVLNLHETITRP